MMQSILPLLWFFLFAGTIILFVILDGADFGIGVLSLFIKKERKSLFIGAVGPFWYANETWLVISGAILFGAFPQAYSLILSSLYIPVIMMIFGLIFRAVSTELRGDSRRQYFWNWAFGIGCTLAALGQGFLLGGLLTRPESISSVSVSAWSWFNPLSILIALGVVIAYNIIGISYLIKHTVSDINSGALRLLRYSTVLVFVIFLIVIILLPLINQVYSQTWNEGNRIILVPLFGVITVCCFVAILFRSGRRVAVDRSLYILSVVAFLGIGSTIVAAIFPYLVPFSISIKSAASPIHTLTFMLFGAGIFLPVVIIYNLYVRKVFS